MTTESANSNTSFDRVYSIEDKGSFVPSAEDINGGIDEALANTGLEVIRSDSFRLMAMEPTSSHNPHGFHTVLWIDKIPANGEAITPWNDEYWDELQADDEFWDIFDRWLTEIRKSNLRILCYSSVGFYHPKETEGKIEGVYEKGMQSQNRPHWHLVEPLDLEKAEKKAVPDWILSASLNLTGEETFKYVLDYYPSLLKGIGEFFSVEQEYGEHSITRNFIACSDIQEAIVLVKELESLFAEHWLEIARHFVGKKAQFNGFSLPLMQAACPGFGIALLNDDNRAFYGLGEEYEVLVAPFYVSGIPQLFTAGGAVLRR